MKLKTAIYYASMFLGLEEVSELIESGETGDDEQEHEKELLLRCANLVVSEIASDWVPLKVRESVVVKGGAIEYVALNKRVVDVYSITDKWGNKVAFREFYDRIMIADGEYEIEYSYLPENVGIDDELPFKKNSPSERVIAYGIACEYSIISGMAEEASIFEQRFTDALSIVTKVKKEQKIKRRRWA